MAFCGDREDVVSMAATAVLKLLEATGVSAAAIGRYHCSLIVSF
jgi:3-hydroxy-3-methylglutaryl CoA synthase